MKLTKTIQTVALASLLALSPAEMMAAQKGGPLQRVTRHFF